MRIVVNTVHVRVPVLVVVCDGKLHDEKVGVTPEQVDRCGSTEQEVGRASV